MSTPCCLALDIGATKIAIGLVPDADPKKVVDCGRLPTQPAGASPSEQVSAAIRLGLEEAEQCGWRVERVGIGAPGVIRAPMGKIVYNGETMKSWASVDLPALVRAEVDVPFACHNDVRIMAYGEHSLGVGREFGCGRVLYLSLGTGVGGAIIEDGQLIDGPVGCAGEVSELVCADFRGFANRCENVASGTGLTHYLNTFIHAPDVAHEGPLGWESSPGPLSLPEVVQLIDATGADSDRAREIISGNLYGFGRAIGAISSAFDLSGIVLGGGVALIGDLILQPFTQGVREAALPPAANVPVRIAQLGHNAPLVGAAIFAKTHAGN